MGFLGALADQLSSQFSLGENTNNTLDAVVDGKNVKYGSLGDFAKNIDQSAERRYVEEGYLRKDPYNTSPKQFEVLMQEPNATILLKKRMFSSLAENFRPDFMDKDEKTYFKAVKILFSNKCRQIAALEKLSKIQKTSTVLGQLDNQIVPLIITLTDTFTNGFGEGSNFWGTLGSSNPFQNTDMSKFVQTINTLRRLYAFNQPNPYTTWLVDQTNTLKSQFGEGTGVIEITNFTQLTTNTGVELGKGDCNFTIVDPYEVMLITEYDIERAIADATNAFYNRKVFQLGKDSSQTLISDLQNRLNQYRADRKASPITFSINPDTLLGKRVRAIIDRVGVEISFTYDTTSAAAIFSGGAFGGGVTVAPEYLKGGAVAGYDGISTDKVKTFGGDSSVKPAFPESELSLFQRLISTIFSQLSLVANSVNSFQQSNKNTNYARRKMRFNFLGKLIIQPMDTVHIYMTSKSRYDNKLLSGLNNMFTGLGFLQNLNNTFADLTNSWNNLFNPSSSVNLQAEKCVMVGPDFPNFLWAIIRGQFVTEKEGVHVFAGLVQSATEQWADGKFTITTQCRDQSKYFEIGKVNFKPGIDVFNGAIFDPLTPFKSNFDSITSNAKAQTPELLDENKYILATGGTPLAKSKFGPTPGRVVTENNLIQDQNIDKTSGLLTKTFYAPDGLVYKWKEGIGVLVQFGESNLLNSPEKVGAVNIAQEPFAGQDVMNVLSLLITGYPYNFITYWNAVINPSGAGRDPMSQLDASYIYLDSLRNTLTKNNTLWGNFIPFKNLMVDDQTYALKLQGQFEMIKQNTDINSKLARLSNIQDSLSIWGVSQTIDDVSANDPRFVALKTEYTQLQIDINAQILKSEVTNSSYFITAGDDVTFDDNAFIQSNQDSKNLTNANIRRLLRKKVNNLTRRMSYDVRANADRNLLIVDDYYDKDYDIMAYNQSLTDGVKLYNNAFVTVIDKIRATSGLLNLEVFCDTQGHIRIRPPQYNRMPSSVFYKMMYLKKSTGVQIFPQFLEDLFSNSVDTLKTKIEIVEDQIRLYGAALGYNTDTDVQFLITNENNVQALGEGQDFTFISDEKSGLIDDIGTVMKIANADDAKGFTFQQLATYGTIELQAQSTKQVFNTVYRAKLILDAITNNKLAQAGYSLTSLTNFSQNTRVSDLITRIQTKSGQRISKDYFTNTISRTGTEDSTVKKQLDIFKITGELSGFIATRQKAVKLLYSTIKNAGEFKYLDDNPDAANQLLTPNLSHNSEIPEVFEHMIEDESDDDLGVGSGSRYIIKRSQIKQMSFSESLPKFTKVEVQGVMNPLAPNALPDGFRSFPDGGNALVTAMVLDYDMWRNYGLSDGNPVQVPFLSDPNTQCAPYATMLLSRARKEVLHGSITISGNEYMQPGEVIFIEDRGLLFYINSVRHSFTYGSGFTTTLELTYGHAPGEYIPTTLDVIGKMIFNNRDTATMIIQRQSNSDNSSNLGIIQVNDSNNPIAISTIDDTNNVMDKYSNENATTLRNILFSAQQLINANNTPGNNVQAKVELRIYYDDNNPPNDDVSKLANSAIEILTGGLEVNIPQSTASGTVSVTTYLDPKNVKKLLTVNLSDATDTHSPSQKALAAARIRVNDSSLSGGGASNPTNTSDGGSGVTTGQDNQNNANSAAVAKKEKDKLRAALFSYIVDCWLVIEEVPKEQLGGA